MSPTSNSQAKVQRIKQNKKLLFSLREANEANQRSFSETQLYRSSFLATNSATKEENRRLIFSYLNSPITNYYSLSGALGMDVKTGCELGYLTKNTRVCTFEKNTRLFPLAAESFDRYRKIVRADEKDWFCLKYDILKDLDVRKEFLQREINHGKVLINFDFCGELTEDLLKELQNLKPIISQAALAFTLAIPMRNNNNLFRNKSFLAKYSGIITPTKSDIRQVQITSFKQDVKDKIVALSYVTLNAISTLFNLTVEWFCIYNNPHSKTPMLTFAIGKGWE